MREIIERNLSLAIDPKIVGSLLNEYDRMIGNYRGGDLEGCLNKAGKFVEHLLRAIEFVRTGNAPAEIKAPAQVVQQIEKDQNLQESLRLLVPRIAHTAIYEIRSKRGAVHVKEIDPRPNDAALCVQAASWILAELIRIYHSDDERTIAGAMASLARAELPMVEIFGGEAVVTGKVSCDIEMLLLIKATAEKGADRRFLGESSKFSPSTVTQTLQRLERQRLVHQTRDGLYHITGPGDAYLMYRMSGQGGTPSPLKRRA